jgi:hypothetical protein
MLTPSNVLKERKYSSFCTYEHCILSTQCMYMFWTLLNKQPLRLCRDYAVCFLCCQNYIFDAFTTKICKDAPISFAISICLPTCNNLRTGEWIFIKFYIGEFQ